MLGTVRKWIETEDSNKYVNTPEPSVIEWPPAMYVLEKKLFRLTILLIGASQTCAKKGDGQRDRRESTDQNQHRQRHSTTDSKVSWSCSLISHSSNPTSRRWEQPRWTRGIPWRSSARNSWSDEWRWSETLCIDSKTREETFESNQRKQFFVTQDRADQTREWMNNWWWFLVVHREGNCWTNPSGHEQNPARVSAYHRLWMKPMVEPSEWDSSWRSQQPTWLARVYSLVQHDGYWHTNGATRVLA